MHDIVKKMTWMKWCVQPTFLFFFINVKMQNDYDRSNLAFGFPCFKLLCISIFSSK